jgi:hypothetical protein
MQNCAMREYAVRRGWIIALQVKEVGSGASSASSWSTACTLWTI